MTKEYDNTDRGVLFKNDRKEQDNHPDYKGSLNVNGVEFWLSAWIKEGSKVGPDGRPQKFMSLSIKPKDQQRQAEPPRRQPPPRRQSHDDGPPW
jgi:hypothetical protein